MDLKVFAPEELSAVLRALRTIAQSNDHYDTEEIAFIEGVARLHDVTLAASELKPMTFDEVARVVTDEHKRKRAVQLAIVMALVEGTPPPATHAAVQSFARALELDEAGLEVLMEVAHGHAFLARFDMFRRLSRFMRNVSDFPGLLGMALPMMGLRGDAELAARYRNLESSPPGTLGRAYFDFIATNGFRFPGEPGGIPLTFHDIGHVLSGYGTDPQGEIQQAAFQAGYARRDGFSFLLFGILQFHIGLRITPVAKGYEGLFDVPRVLEALRRGAACRVDLSEGYDLFANKDRALDEVRAELGVPPLSVPARAS
jgi:hypothetical protein